MLMGGIPAVPKQDELNEHADIWLAEAGDDSIYYSVTTGVSVSTAVSIERDVEVMDNMGRVVRHIVAYIRSGLVAPAVGDVITNEGRDYIVEEFSGDDGYITTLYLANS